MAIDWLDALLAVRLVGLEEVVGQHRLVEVEAESALDDAASRAEAAGVNCEQLTRGGNPHEVIAEYVADRDIDLVVMGASGRSGLKKHVLGSTTDRVVRTVDTSVLIARQ